MRGPKMHPVLGICLVLATIVPSALGQEPEEPALRQLERALKRGWLDVGLLLQVVVDAQDTRTFSGQNGVSIANARVSLSGDLDRGFGYFFQGSFADDAKLLDGRVSYEPTRGPGWDLGLFKAPFSAEFLTSAASIDFVNRSQVVTALAPGRSAGLQARGAFADRRVGWAAGLFNGNRGAAGNDNDRFLRAGRVTFEPRAARRSDGDRLLVGINAAASEDADYSAGGFFTAFAGRRSLVGIDARWTRSKWLLATEVIRARLTPLVGPRTEPDGLHLTAGYATSPRTQVLLRWDTFSADDGSADSDWVVLGLNFWPTGASELQVNFVHPVEGIHEDQILVNAQIAF